MVLTYYEKQEAKINIMHGLKEKGWTIYGYKPDQSDPMTDYFSPADWDGIAEKDGYILLVDICPYDLSKSGSERRGQIYPIFHHANPGRCNWHIEKDGHIIAKGNGAFKCYIINDHLGKETKKQVDQFIHRIEQAITDYERKNNKRQNKNNNNKQAITATYKINHEKNGIELTFNGIPGQNIRNELKNNGFRWSPKQRIWYAKLNNQRLHFVEALTSIYSDRQMEQTNNNDYSNDNSSNNSYNNNNSDNINNNNNATNNTQKIKVKHIKINWSECPYLEEGRIFHSFKEADNAIRLAAMRHDGQGYWKTSYTVIYEDGQIYNGRIDITNKDNSLTKWMLNFVMNMAGLKKPAHWSNEEYQAYIKEHREDWLHFYNTYQIGDHVETETITDKPANNVINIIEN